MAHQDPPDTVRARGGTATVSHDGERGGGHAEEDQDRSRSGHHGCPISEVGQGLANGQAGGTGRRCFASEDGAEDDERDPDADRGMEIR